MSLRACITGTGAFSPPRIVTNDDLSKILNTSDEWIQSRTGIKQRHIIDYEGAMTTVDMAEQASIRALNISHTHAHELDMIIFATVTPDYRVPSAACVLQNRLGAKNACVFDVVAACSGSLYAFQIARQFIATQTHRKILVIGAETLSVLANWDDRNTAVLFGDAGAAAVVEPSRSDSGFIDVKLYSDGTQWQTIWVPQGGSKSPPSHEMIDNKGDRLVMNGRETYKFAVRVLTEAALDILARNHLNVSQISHVVAHQANLRIIEAVAERLQIPLEKFVINIDRYANTSSASLLTTFDEGKRTRRFHDGDNILMLAIGAGFVWGAGLYRY